MILVIECVLVIMAFVLAFMIPQWNNWLRPLERRFACLARRRTTAVLVVGGSALLIRVLLLPILPIPEPAVHDEFSYLLMADTFAHGRLANPTHPMWVHFETFHEIEKPTYVSMYYPAQGVFLAIGQVFFGHPFWGVWLSTGLMCAAMCWMLQGWLPPVWALLGGLLAVIRIGIFSYWMNSYWGGSVAALGGALVLGALPRVMRHHRLRDVVLMGTGFAILANSRPYEGLFFSIPVLAILLLWMKKPASPAFRTVATKVVLPLTVLCGLTLAAMGYYFWRTTGSPIRTPYAVDAATYHPVPFFPWQRVKPAPQYHDAALRNFYLTWRTKQYNLARSHPFALVLIKAVTAWFFFVGPLFTLPLFAACLSAPYGLSFKNLSRKTRRLSIVCACVGLGCLLPVAFESHYAAAATCCIYGLLLATMSHIRHWRARGRPVGLSLVRAIPIVAVVMACVAAVPQLRANSAPPVPAWYSPIVSNSYRARIAHQLSDEPGSHLVLVRYGPTHAPMTEWVFNGADIDHAKIVWARDMGDIQNTELIHYFANRHVWRIEPDKIPPKLLPYDENTVTEAEGR